MYTFKSWLSKIGTLVLAGAAGVALWFEIVAPTMAIGGIFVILVCGAVASSMYHDKVVGDAAYAEGQEEVRMPQELSQRNAPRVRVVLPDDLLSHHGQMNEKVQLALNILEEACGHSKAATEGLYGVNEHVVGVQRENAQLREEVLKIDAIGSILSQAPARQVAPANPPSGGSSGRPASVTAFAPKRVRANGAGSEPAVTEPVPAPVPQFLTREVDLKRLEDELRNQQAPAEGK